MFVRAAAGRVRGDIKTRMYVEGRPEVGVRGEEVRGWDNQGYERGCSFTFSYPHAGSAYRGCNFELYIKRK